MSTTSNIRIRARSLVIGAGAAGLYAALRAARDGSVIVVTKESLADSNSALAQGGIAAALDDDDSPRLHAADTIAAGAPLCDASAVEVLVTEGPDRVRELALAGAPFDRAPDGALSLGREGAHSRSRIVHALGDRTGFALVATLARLVRATPAITLLEHARAIELIVHDGQCLGARATHDGELLELIADATILATGGAGQLYRCTTNPAGATGDGIALAHRAGVALADLEFVQFHPTALDAGTSPLPLISEAVRGEGAILLDGDGRRFMPALHPRAELAPRDVVARAVVHAQRESGRVVLDATALAPDFAQRFPAIFAACIAHGLDPRTEPIPITPAAHYLMGGVVTDLHGRSSLGRLYAVGEVARTGVHGANRLASNSLLECLVFADRAARDIASVRPLGDLLTIRTPTNARLPIEELPAPAARELRDLMWAHAGVMRTGRGLAHCLDRLAQLPVRDHPMLTAARLIVHAALRRHESVGAHFRADVARRTASLAHAR